MSNRYEVLLALLTCESRYGHASFLLHVSPRCVNVSSMVTSLSPSVPSFLAHPTLFARSIFDKPTTHMVGMFIHDQPSPE